MYPKNIAQYNKIHDPLNNKMAAKEVKDESISTQMVEDDSKQHVSTELDSCGVVIERPLPLLLQLQQARDHSPNCVVIITLNNHYYLF